MRESVIQKRIRAVLNHPATDTRVFRNNVGTLPDGRGGYISFGLAVGSGDLIGIHTVLVTPDMVGQKFGRFLSVECKTLKGKVSEEQEIWKSTIRNRGGEALIFRSPEDAVAFIEGKRHDESN